MPLYPDEIAFRLLRSRYIADGATAYGLLPCLANAQQIPLVFHPFAYALSVLDGGLGWSMLRYPQVAGVMLVLGATLLVAIRRKAAAAALTALAGLIGVVGSGLVLSRGEAPMLFLSVACMAGFGIVTWSRCSSAIAALYLVTATSLALLAMFVHQQAMILMPILLLLMFAIGLRKKYLPVRVLAGICVAVTCLGSIWTLRASQINCPEFPSVAPIFATMELSGVARQQGWPGVQTYLSNKLPAYAASFAFNRDDSLYLPGIDLTSFPKSLSLLNAGILYAVQFNLVLAFGVMIVLGAQCIKTVVSQNGLFLERAANLLIQPSLYIGLGIAGHLALLVYDVPTAFYRNFHVYFTLVMLNVIALSGIRGRARLLLWPIAAVSLVLCVASALLSREIDSRFVKGWVGPSVRLDTDWQTLRGHVRNVAGRCNIRDGDAGIVIDDLTYDGMKQHPHLIPITYIGFALSARDADAASFSRLLRRVSATAVVASCGVLRGRGLTPQYEDEGICCLKLPVEQAMR